MRRRVVALGQGNGVALWYHHCVNTLGNSNSRTISMADTELEQLHTAIKRQWSRARSSPSLYGSRGARAVGCNAVSARASGRRSRCCGTPISSWLRRWVREVVQRPLSMSEGRIRQPGSRTVQPHCGPRLQSRRPSVAFEACAFRRSADTAAQAGGGKGRLNFLYSRVLACPIETCTQCCYDGTSVISRAVSEGASDGF